MFIETTNSTNDWLLERQKNPIFRSDPYPEVWTTHQTAGRGQVGNHWESEPKQNILMSLSTINREQPLKANEAFKLTMASSLAICEAVEELTSLQPQIKWPNDIYIGDRKLCGILIEGALSGDHFAYNIIGIGLNVNQTRWSEQIPNPTSLRREAKGIFDLYDVHQCLLRNLHKRLDNIYDQSLIQDYWNALYRKDNFYTFREIPSGKEILAHISDITEQGALVLETLQGEEKTYLLKQIQFVI